MLLLFSIEYGLSESRICTASEPRHQGDISYWDIPGDLVWKAHGLRGLGMNPT